MIDDTVKGLAFGAAGAISYGMNPLFALPLYAEGLTPDSVLFYRYLGAIFFLAALMRARRVPFGIAPRESVLLAVMGALMASSSLFLFLSYNFMAAGIASTLLFVYPLMVALIMAFRFREKFSAITAASIALTLAGTALLYKGEDGAALSLAGIGLVMLSALLYAIYIVCVNKTALSATPALKLTFYATLFGSLLFVFRLDFLADLQMLPSWRAFACALLLGIFPTGVSFACVARSISLIGSTPAAILGALEPVTAVIFGVLVFGEALTPRLSAGIALIIFAVLLVVAGKRLPALFRLARGGKNA